MSVTSFQEAKMAILDVYSAGVGSWSTFQADKLREILAETVPPAQVSYFAEFCYAHLESLWDEARQMGADVATFAAANGFYGLGVDQRGFVIAALLRGIAQSSTPAVDQRWVDAAAAEDQTSDRTQTLASQQAGRIEPAEA